MNQLQHITDPKIIRVGRIGYINVAPVYYGLEQAGTPSHIRLISQPPAVLNRMMEQGMIDISPVSSAAFARNHHDWSLLPNLSISAFGKVMSVLLVSNHPLEKLENRNILLSDESASAADMLKLILSWKKIFPQFETGAIHPDNSSTWENHDAVLVIGNSALTGGWQNRFQYVYDLGELWKQVTGLPFVFAVWAVRKTFARENSRIVTDIAGHFERSKQLGRMNMPEIRKAASNLLNLDPNECRTYFEKLQYGLGHFELQGLKTFYQGLYAEKIVPERVKLSFFPTLIQGKKTKSLIGPESAYILSGYMKSINRQKAALLNLGLIHLPLPLKKVFPQLLHLFRQGRP
ncbi:MAG: ABC transporter substrate-binding protein [Desulfobacteraceae bacterium]|nr:MAG: ABC transporter substrate-binding protein [Desulfobacteraceae bacterium]